MIAFLNDLDGWLDLIHERHRRFFNLDPKQMFVEHELSNPVKRELLTLTEDFGWLGGSFAYSPLEQSLMHEV